MQIAPENTMIASEYAADSNVFAFESDVIIRWKLYKGYFYYSSRATFLT